MEKVIRPSSPARVKATVPGAAKMRRYEVNTWLQGGAHRGAPGRPVSGCGVGVRW